MTPEEEAVKEIEKLLKGVLPKVVSRFVNNTKTAEKIMKISRRYVERKMDEWD